MTVHKGFAKTYAIQAFPTLLFFAKGGRKIYRYSGPRTFDALLAFAKDGWKSAEECMPLPPAKLQPTQ